MLCFEPTQNIFAACIFPQTLQTCVKCVGGRDRGDPAVRSVWRVFGHPLCSGPLSLDRVDRTLQNSEQRLEA